MKWRIQTNRKTIYFSQFKLEKLPTVQNYLVKTYKMNKKKGGVRLITITGPYLKQK